MISKEEFIEIIDRLKETDDIKTQVNRIIRNSTDSCLSDFTDAGSIMICHEDLVVKLLENMFNNNDVISYWLYERNYGRDYKTGDITDNGKKINLSTPGKLYDYLIKSMEVL